MQLLAPCAFTAGAQVQSLVRELGFCKLRSLAKKNPKNQPTHTWAGTGVSQGFCSPNTRRAPGRADVQRQGDVPGRALWSREPPRLWMSPKARPLPAGHSPAAPGTQAKWGSAALWQLLAGCLSRFWAGPSAWCGCPASSGVGAPPLGWMPRLFGGGCPASQGWTTLPSWRPQLMGTSFIFWAWGCAGDPRGLVPCPTLTALHSWGLLRL